MLQDAITRATAILTTRHDVEFEAAHSLLTRLASLYEQSTTEAAVAVITAAARDPVPVRPERRHLDGTAEALSLDDLQLGAANLVRDLPHLAPADMLFAVDELVAAAARHVPGARYAGITALHRHRHVDTPSATGRYPAFLDAVQDRHHQGPCLEAIRLHRTVQVDDLNTERRWPDYRREALTHTPIRSVLSVPMASSRTQASSALNFYAEEPDAFAGHPTDGAAAFASYTALAWTILCQDAQFRRALASRDVIGQAKGMLMERYDVDAESAFSLLTKLSQDSNVPLVEVARRLVGAEKHRPCGPPEDSVRAC
jgi:hypothetical protein